MSHFGMLGALALVAASSTLSASPEQWSGRELGQAGPVAVEEVRTTVGADAYVSMNSLTLRRATGGNGASVTAHYKDDARASLTCSHSGMKIACAVSSPPAQPAEATLRASGWGGRELGQSAEAAADEIKNRLGQAAYDAITSIQVDRRPQGNAASVTVAMEGGRGTRSMFCHTHGSSIDCHMN